MSNISAKEVLNNSKGKTEKQGEQLAKAVLQEMEKDKVNLDMSSLVLIRIKFFKMFITKLKERYSIDELLDKLVIEYSIDNDKDIMQMVIENVYGGI